MKLEKHIEASSLLDSTPSAKVVELIQAESELSKPQIKKAMNRGAVWLSSEFNPKSAKRVRRADKTAKPGDNIHIYYDEQILEQQATPPELMSDEGDYSIWYKPYGMLCQGSKWGDHCTINRWVETHHQPQKPAFIVHRLDRAASGLILLAHKKKTAAYFSSLFDNREIDKKYQAIVSGQFPGEYIFDSEIDGKSAHTRARLAEYQAERNLSLLDVEIKTGRKHQIRKHLSEAGFPILGDRLYGRGQDAHNLVDLRLTSCYLAFQCPVEHKEKEFRLPEHLLLKLDRV